MLDLIPESFNIYLSGLPTGDDYFLLFINVTHGGLYATYRASPLPTLPLPTRRNHNQNHRIGFLFALGGIHTQMK